MKSKKTILLPEYAGTLKQLGENIKLARKKRKLTTIQVSGLAAIDRSTLYKIEKGNPGVALGAYFNTLRVLGLQNDFLKLAAEGATEDTTNQDTGEKNEREEKK